jgi:hypothetical protein
MANCLRFFTAWTAGVCWHDGNYIIALIIAGAVLISIMGEIK